MKFAILTLALLPFLAGVPAMAQALQGVPAGRGAPPPVEIDKTAPTEDFKPSSLNQPGKQYPEVNSQRRVRTQLRAPNAQTVLIDMGGVRYPMTKGENGVWTGVTNAQDEGFHYYQLNVDGVSIPDSGTQIFYGSSRWGGAVEIPAHDQDFYALKNVPHGQLREVHYFSKVAKTMLQSFVYTPPDYEKSTKRYPVLYLQHGAGEDEHGWGGQGFAGLIMDNLIAEGKATPFIIVISNSYLVTGGAGGGRGPGPGAAPGVGRGRLWPWGRGPRPDGDERYPVRARSDRRHHPVHRCQLPHAGGSAASRSGRSLHGGHADTRHHPCPHRQVFPHRHVQRRYYRLIRN